MVACLAWLAVLAGGAAGCGSNDEDAVVVYTSVDQQLARKVLDAFTEQTGIEVRMRGDTEASKTAGLAQRLRAEAADPAADVFWSSEIFYTIRLGREGFLAPYRSKTTADWPDQFADPGGLWHAFALRGRVIVYNTDRVSPGEAPRRLEDLLDAKWRGRIVMARPQFGTTGGDVASWFAHYGPDRATEILAGLKANDIRLAAGNSHVVREVASGCADVGFTDTDDVHVARRNGLPVAMTPLDQGGDGALAIPNTVALVAGAPHPKAAARLIEFLLSEWTERMLAESDSHNTPVRPQLAEGYGQWAISPPLKIDYARVADCLADAMDEEWYR